MKKFTTIFILSGCFALLIGFQKPEDVIWESEYINICKDGSITYKADDEGNVIPDFSRVGYCQGDKAIPDVPVRKTIFPPESGDSRLLIQNAIDDLAKLTPDENGFRGAVLLKKGTYKISGSINISASGIVLRGDGNDEGGTKVIAAGNKKRSLLVVSGKGNLNEIPGTRRKILNKHLPVGAMSIVLESTKGLNPGDDIILFRPGVESWISDLKMDEIVEREGTRQWKGEDYNLNFERYITKINGDTIFIDNPVVMPIEEKYGGGEIFEYEFEGRISNVGVENILFESEFTGDTDEDHGWIAIEIEKAENGWVQNVTSRFFGYACVSLGGTAKQFTVLDSKSLEPKSIITGGRRYSFNNNGQLNLFMNLYAEDGRHDYVTGSKTLGPNVFYNCSATNAHADIGPHHRWSVGTLYDNIKTDGEINVQDRGNWGSGHGWAGVTQVIWNCVASSAAVQNPWVTGKNYCIGLQGERDEGRLPLRLSGEWEGHNKPGLTPQSLYLSQLKARQKDIPVRGSQEKVHEEGKKSGK